MIDKLKMEEKRGVSPLIATVLLVALVIIIAILIWFWYAGFIGNLQDKQEVELELSCIQDLEFQIYEFSCEVGAGNNQINFEVENKGSEDILSFIVSYSGDAGSGSSDVGVGVSQGLSSLIGITTGEIHTGSVDLEIIPIIGSFDNPKICDSKYQMATVLC